MIRPFTALCLLMAGGSGLYLYQAKHQSQMLDREIARVVHQADTTRERAGVLRAEYALLNDPERLGDLAQANLPSLKTTAPTQFTTWNDFEKRLPAVGAPPAEPAPLEPDAPVIASASPATGEDAGHPTASMPSLISPAMAAETKPADAKDAKVDAKADTKPVAPARPRALAAANPAQPAAQPVPAQPTPWAAAPVAPVTARPVGAPVSLTASLGNAGRPAPAPRPATTTPAPAYQPTSYQPPAYQAPAYAAASNAESGYAARSYAAPSYAAPAAPVRTASRAETAPIAAAPVSRPAPAAAPRPVPAAASALGMARLTASPAPQSSGSYGAPAIWQPDGASGNR